MSTLTPPTPPTAPRFESECVRTIADLRAALIELYASLEVDPAQPQEVARRFSLNKNLTWKLSKIIHATDGFSAIPHIPGVPGWEIFLNTMGVAGAPEFAITRVREALRGFDEFVTLHAGERADLELILDSMGVAGSGTNQLETSRQLAYQGNSGIWGIQARTRITTAFLRVNPADPDHLLSALVGGFVGFRRLRPDVAWPLFRFTSWHDDGSPLPQDMEEIEPGADNGGLTWLMRRFCSPNLPKIERRRNGTATEYTLLGGPVGNMGAFNCFFGNVSGGWPRYASEGDDTGEFGSAITLPIETLIFDVIVHQSVGFPGPPSVEVYGSPSGLAAVPSLRVANQRIPLTERCVELAGQPPVVLTPLAPRYGELVAAVIARLGGAPNEYRGYRLTLKYPPMMSQVVLRWPLPARPS